MKLTLRGLLDAAVAAAGPGRLGPICLRSLAAWHAVFVVSYARCQALVLYHPVLLT